MSCQVREGKRVGWGVSCQVRESKMVGWGGGVLPGEGG